jgi:hypothetical protein
MAHGRDPGEQFIPPDPEQPKPRQFSWALSKEASAELRITGELAKAEADRLRQYVELTVGALVADDPV